MQAHLSLPHVLHLDRTAPAAVAPGEMVSLVAQLQLWQSVATEAFMCFVLCTFFNATT